MLASSQQSPKAAFVAEIQAHWVGTCSHHLVFSLLPTWGLTCPSQMAFAKLTSSIVSHRTRRWNLPRHGLGSLAQGWDVQPHKPYWDESCMPTGGLALDALELHPLISGKKLWRQLPKASAHLQTAVHVVLRKRMMCSANNCGLLLHLPEYAGSVLLVSCSCITFLAVASLPQYLIWVQCDMGAKYPQRHKAQDRPEKLLVALETLQ